MDKIEQLPVDDWTDQDLLTKQAARERLVEEIERTRAQLAALRAQDGADPAEIHLVSRRLDAMESMRNEYDGPGDQK
jgi:hypothetical protein